jgi:hypothetical protein
MLTILRHHVDPTFLLHAIDGARLSYGSGARADSTVDAIGPNDTALLQKLIRSGGRMGEDKFRRCIPVSVFIKAPLRWWTEADTYKVGTVKQSSSLMHRLARVGPFTADEFSPDTDPRSIEIVNEHWQAWHAAGAKRNSTCEHWRRMQDAIPRGFDYEAQLHLSYAVLATMHAQRRSHRQGEWRTFCAWTETLPHAWLITGEDQQ